jgi:hypothetical protein
MDYQIQIIYIDYQVQITYIPSDAIQPSKDPLEVLVGPVTRLRAKKFKEASSRDMG